MHISRLLTILCTILVLALLAGCGSDASIGTTGKAMVVKSSSVTNGSASTIRSGSVTLSVDAPIYFVSSTISIRLSNQSKRTIYFADHLTNCTVVLLQRQMNGGWQNLNLCRLGIATRLHSLGAGQRLVVRLVPPPKGWLTGLYRASLSYLTSLNAGQPMTIRSAVFKVITMIRPVP